jgi:uncharacterized membrane protein
MNFALRLEGFTPVDAHFEGGLFMTQPPGTDAHAPVPPPQPPYEFTSAQDDIIRALAGKMKFVGIFYIVASCFVGLAGLISLFFSPLISAFYLVLLTPELLIGIWTINAAQSFKLIVETRGRDIPHLIGALTALRKLYTLMFWLLIVALVLVLLAIAAGVLLWTMGIIPGTREAATYTALML